MRQSVELTETEKDQPVHSPTGIVLTGPQKGIALFLLLIVLYWRLWRRKRSKDRICSHCGYRNPRHRTNCTNCSAPMFME